MTIINANRSRVIICILLLFTLQSYSQSSLPRLQQMDARHYTFYLELSDQTNEITGRATITIKFLKDLDQFTLDLVKMNADSLGMQVLQVLEDGKSIDYTHEEEKLVIQPKKAIKAGQERQFSIRYQGTPGDGLIIGINKHGDRTFFGDNWPNRAHHWLPCIDHPSDKASVEFIVAAPDHYQVVANGVQIEELNLNDEIKLTHWKEIIPIPMKVAVIGVARFGVKRAGEVYGIPVSSWVYRQDRMDGYQDYSQALDVLKFFIDSIGPYPYRKLANVQSKTRYGGMENASNIFYFENSVTGNGEHEDLIAHEIAHQWFGNAASELNWHHIWLSEGFATYGADLYMEHQYGREKMVDRLQTERQQVVAYSMRASRPVVDTTVTDWNQLLNPNSYQKGGWVLHMLRRKVGEQAFWEGLKNYYLSYAGKNALTKDFQQIMESSSGQDLSTFFQQWIFQPGHPDLNVEWQYTPPSQLTIAITQLQKNPFSFPLDLMAIDADGKEERWQVNINDAQERFQLDCSFEPNRILLDPDTWLLFQAQIKH